MVLSEVVGLLEEARRSAARSVNAIMTATYWEVGRRIVEFDQGGQSKAQYGKKLIARLSEDLIKKFGRSFSVQNLRRMRVFYLSYQKRQIRPTSSVELNPNAIQQTASGESSSITISAPFPLPWSHYVKLLAVRNQQARAFYEKEALRNGWTVRQLTRQIDSQFYERTALSRNKKAMLESGAGQTAEDKVAPEEEIKDPFVLEFLDLKDEYSENDLEEALIKRLECFLLELGGDFTFVGRQRRLRIGDEWFRVDLVFFHRRLRCLMRFKGSLASAKHPSKYQNLNCLGNNLGDISELARSFAGLV